MRLLPVLELKMLQLQMFRLYVFITETVTSVRITFFIYIGKNIYRYMSACDCCRTKGAVIADVSPVCHWHQRHLQPVWEQKNQMWPQEIGVGVSGVRPCDELGYVLVMNWGTSLWWTGVHPCEELGYVLVMNWGTSLWWTGVHPCDELGYVLVMNWGTSLWWTGVCPCDELVIVPS